MTALLLAIALAAPAVRDVYGVQVPESDALFRVWLGDDPVDSGLKERMLGR
jgi:hypothetical protein